jgi:hypothetical protein
MREPHPSRPENRVGPHLHNEQELFLCMYPLAGPESRKMFLFCGFAIDPTPGFTGCRSNVAEKGDNLTPIGSVPEVGLAVGTLWQSVSKGPETGPFAGGARWAADSQVQTQARMRGRAEMRTLRPCAGAARSVAPEKTWHVRVVSFVLHCRAPFRELPFAAALKGSIINGYGAPFSAQVRLL